VEGGKEWEEKRELQSLGKLLEGRSGETTSRYPRNICIGQRDRFGFLRQLTPLLYSTDELRNVHCFRIRHGATYCGKQKSQNNTQKTGRWFFFWTCILYIRSMVQERPRLGLLLNDGKKKFCNLRELVMKWSNTTGTECHDINVNEERHRKWDDTSASTMWPSRH